MNIQRKEFLMLNLEHLLEQNRILFAFGMVLRQTKGERIIETLHLLASHASLYKTFLSEIYKKMTQLERHDVGFWDCMQTPEDLESRGMFMTPVITLIGVGEYNGDFAEHLIFASVIVEEVIRLEYSCGTHPDGIVDERQLETATDFCALANLLGREKSPMSLSDGLGVMAKFASPRNRSMFMCLKQSVDADNPLSFALRGNAGIVQNSDSSGRLVDHKTLDLILEAERRDGDYGPAFKMIANEMMGSVLEMTVFPGVQFSHD